MYHIYMYIYKGYIFSEGIPGICSSHFRSKSRPWSHLPGRSHAHRGLQSLCGGEGEVPGAAVAESVKVRGKIELLENEDNMEIIWR